MFTLQIVKIQKQSKNKLNETHQKSHKSENQEFKIFQFCPTPYIEKSFENPIFPTFILIEKSIISISFCQNRKIL